VVHPANISDKVGGEMVLKSLPYSTVLEEIRVDQGYDSPALKHWFEGVFNAELSVSQPNPDRKGFVVQKGRWVVERTLAWLGRYRRLSKDYEQHPKMSESFCYIASIHLLLRRLTRLHGSS
jgi:putative transposase